jgi:hypothetical protein
MMIDAFNPERSGDPHLPRRPGYVGNRVATKERTMNSKTLLALTMTAAIAAAVFATPKALATGCGYRPSVQSYHAQHYAQAVVVQPVVAAVVNPYVPTVAAQIVAPVVQAQAVVTQAVAVAPVYAQAVVTPVVAAVKVQAFHGHRVAAVRVVQPVRVQHVRPVRVQPVVKIQAGTSRGFLRGR